MIFFDLPFVECLRLSWALGWIWQLSGGLTEFDQGARGREEAAWGLQKQGDWGGGFFSHLPSARPMHWETNTRCKPLNWTRRRKSERKLRKPFGRPRSFLKKLRRRWKVWTSISQLLYRSLWNPQPSMSVWITIEWGSSQLSRMMLIGCTLALSIGWSSSRNMMPGLKRKGRSTMLTRRLVFLQLLLMMKVTPSLASPPPSWFSASVSFSFSWVFVV